MCFCLSDLKPPETAWVTAGEWPVFFVHFPLRPVFFLPPPAQKVLKSELVLSIQESPETCLAMEHIHVKRYSIPRLDSQSVTNKAWQMYQFHRVPILFMMILKLTNI